MAGKPHTAEQRAAAKERRREDKLRLLMFHTAHEHLYLSEMDMPLRFVKSLVYSAQAFTPKMRAAMVGWEDKLAKLQAETPRYANGGIRKVKATDTENVDIPDDDYAPEAGPLGSGLWPKQR